MYIQSKNIFITSNLLLPVPLLLLLNLFLPLTLPTSLPCFLTDRFAHWQRTTPSLTSCVQYYLGGQVTANKSPDEILHWSQHIGCFKRNCCLKERHFNFALMYLWMFLKDTSILQFFITKIVFSPLQWTLHKFKWSWSRSVVMIECWQNIHCHILDRLLERINSD